jgi:hypothetical protein
MYTTYHMTVNASENSFGVTIAKYDKILTRYASQGYPVPTHLVWQRSQSGSECVTEIKVAKKTAVWFRHRHLFINSGIDL